MINFQPGKKFLKSKRDKIYYYIPSNYFWNKSIRKNYRLLMQSQWWGYKKLLDLQLSKLSKLLNFAYRYVPFYRKTFKELNIVPDDIKTVEDLKVLPIIDKDFVIENYNDFIPECNFQKLLPARTSGSSGQPLTFKWHPNYFHIKAAANYRFYNWTGKRWTDREMHLGFPLKNLISTELYKIEYKNKEWHMNIKGLDDFKLEQIIRLIEKIKPEIISGYASFIDQIADRLLEKNQILEKYPGSILTTGEMVTDETREKIQKALKAKVFDWYGLVEGCASAAQCKFGNYHLNMEYNLVEFIEQDSILKIIGSNLENFAFPLIRYDTDDTGEFLGYDCPCKRGLPIMKLTAGRVRNFIKDSSGKKYIVPSSFVAALNLPIKEMQIVQDNINSLEMYIVRKKNFGAEDVAKLSSGLGEYVNDSMKINIHFVDNIKRGPRGKHQMIISKV